MSASFKAWLVDVAERAVFSFLETFLALFVVADLSTAKTAAVAGLTAAFAVVKGALASLRKDTISPASTVK